MIKHESTLTLFCILLTIVDGKVIELYNRAMMDIGNGRYGEGVTCSSACKIGSKGAPDTSERISCRRNNRSIRKELQWIPSPLVCTPMECPTSQIFPPPSHGRWRPEKCMMQKKVPVLTVCELMCDEFYSSRDNKRIVKCEEAGWTAAAQDFACDIYPQLARLIPTEPPKSAEELEAERIQDIISGRLEVSEEEYNRVMGETEAGRAHTKQRARFEAEFNDRFLKTMNEQDEARDILASQRQHGIKQSEQAAREEAEALERAELAASREEEERVQAQIAANERRLRQYDASRLHQVPPVAQSVAETEVKIEDTTEPHRANNKIKLLGVEREELELGAKEIGEGIAKVAKSSSMLIIIILSSSLGVVFIGIIVTIIYFSRRRRQQYALVNERNEQLVAPSSLRQINHNNNLEYSRGRRFPSMTPSCQHGRKHSQYHRRYHTSSEDSDTDSSSPACYSSVRIHRSSQGRRHRGDGRRHRYSRRYSRH